ncbi:MAG: hypothetical protein ACJ8EM_09490 [Sphingomicrobium sp.]
MPRLKVFCASSGFHDAIVAATSRPAALKAWGARTDLFSMGVAKEVTDPKIRKRALERPGEVIRLNRSGGPEEAAPSKRKPKRKESPPSRAKLKSAEERLEALTRKQDVERDAIERELRVLEKKRDAIDKRHAKARGAAERKLEQAREDYQAALADWEA